MMNAKKKILLVDDDRDFVESNRLLLESEGFEVHSAYDGKGGVEKAREIRPDLMILDVMMATDTEGFDVSRDIPRIPELQGLPIIILTGIREKKQLAFGFEPDDSWLPCKCVIEKPVQPGKLLEEIRKCLA